MSSTDRKSVVKKQTSELEFQEVLASGLLLGEVNNFCRVYDIIGKGSFGEVKKGCLKGTKELVALKFISKKQAVSFKVDLTLESRILRKLGHHPNIIRYIGLYESEDKLHYVIATEFAAGRDLLSRITFENFGIEVHAKYSEAELALIFFQVLCAVHHCHRHNVIHGDIKTQNILCTDSKRKKTFEASVKQIKETPLKLADFGEAVFCTPPSKVVGGGGTYVYMSPERLKKETYSFSSDIWSLGVVLWELASGEVPWCGSTNVAVLQSMQDYPLTRASSPLKSEEGYDLLIKIFNTDEDKRPTAHQLFSHSWVSGEAKATSPNKDIITEIKSSLTLRRFRALARGMIASRRMH
ncbi:uncharacterized protein LOC135145023 isoform X2 [Zophobas morio]|uniref:uncharacterized protein LOC135145023 isoform X2 n=1 Tax=Zophobas morio TaxID=2755281 RepID=UPI003083D583